MQTTCPNTSDGKHRLECGRDARVCAYCGHDMRKTTMSWADYRTAKFGTNWVLSNRATAHLKRKYSRVVKPAEYDALELQWAKEHPEAFRAEFEQCNRRTVDMLRAAGLYPVA